MAKKITVRLTPRQAHIVWGIVDGAADAGACADGLSKTESAALNSVCSQILSQITPHKINVNSVDLPEAANDLLAAFDGDYRTVGYRLDLWDRLRTCLDEGTA